jgi:hypothetical protein
MLDGIVIASCALRNTRLRGVGNYRILEISNPRTWGPAFNHATGVCEPPSPCSLLPPTVTAPGRPDDARSRPAVDVARCTRQPATRASHGNRPSARPPTAAPQ